MIGTLKANEFFVFDLRTLNLCTLTYDRYDKNCFDMARHRLNIVKENICSLYVPKRTRSLVKNKDVFKPVPILRIGKVLGFKTCFFKQDNTAC